jgi:predicted RNase H-like HicB family nuclease
MLSLLLDIHNLWVLYFGGLKPTLLTEGGYYARVKGIACHSHGDTLEHAAEQIKEALECHLESAIANNIPISEPISESNCSGKLNIRTRKSIHCKLLKIAEEEEVSVSHLINDALVKVYG